MADNAEWWVLVEQQFLDAERCTLFKKTHPKVQGISTLFKTQTCRFYTMSKNYTLSSSTSYVANIGSTPLGFCLRGAPSFFQPDPVLTLVADKLQPGEFVDSLNFNNHWNHLLGQTPFPKKRNPGKEIWNAVISISSNIWATVAVCLGCWAQAQCV